MDSLLLEVVQSVYHLNLTSPNSVQTSNAKDIGFPQHRQARTELMSLFQGCCAGNLLKEHLIASICFEVIHLRVGVLVGGADPCVSDFPSHLFGKSLPFQNISRK